MIGIVTYYEALNFGAVLQAYALQTYLEEQNHEVKLIKHNSIKNVKVKDCCVESGEKLFLEKHYLAIKEFQKHLNIGDSKQCFETAILGSDEIWNIRNLGCRPLPVLYGLGINASKVIAYAPSSGKTKYWQFAIFPYTIFGIRKLHSIGVRDSNTYNAISKLAKLSLEYVVDPTFLIDYSQKFTPVKYSSYILIYSYGLSEKEKELIVKYAREEKKIIISTGTYLEWADLNLAPSPFEWISLIKNADYFFTNTFHGTVFAVITNQQFLSFGSHSSKIVDLLKSLNLLERSWDSSDGYDKFFTLIERRIQYKDVNLLVEEKVEKSKKFLTDALKR